MKTYAEIGSKTRLVTDGSLQYIEFECFDKYRDRLIHCMSTRKGGVSTGEGSTLNLGFGRNDSRENVVNNFKIICRSLGVDDGSLVLSNQVHENKVKIVDEKDTGKGYCAESDIIGYDGLMTAAPGVTLVTFYADCVPVFLYDGDKNVAASVHSGWRSTLKGIAAEAVLKMRESFSCNPASIVAAVGPSICKCCFEVHEDVYRMFAAKYEDPRFYEYIGSGKWKIDLQGIIERTLMLLGVPQENITLCGICTKCRRDLFFSHRGDCGKTGSLAAFMHIRNDEIIKPDFESFLKE